MWDWLTQLCPSARCGHSNRVGPSESELMSRPPTQGSKTLLMTPNLTRHPPSSPSLSPFRLLLLPFFHPFPNPSFPLLLLCSFPSSLSSFHHLSLSISSVNRCCQVIVEAGPCQVQHQPKEAVTAMHLWSLRNGGEVRAVDK